MDPLTATTTLAESHVAVHLVDGRTHTRALLAELPPEARDGVAADAWRIGLRALGSAIAQAREACLEDVGARLEETLQAQIVRLGEEQRARLTELLARFFDPREGQVSARLEAFVREGGELETLLRRHLDPENGTLATALARRVGEHSPLFRLLDPAHGEGAVQAIRDAVKAALDGSRLSMAQALDPRHVGSPVAAFLDDLRRALEDAERRRENQLEVLTRELDANRADSLLSQLVARTTEAQRELQRALNPTVADSPMRLVREALERQLAEARDQQARALGELARGQEDLRSEVRAALARMEARREARSASPAGGRDFELEWFERLRVLCADLPVFVDRVGDRVGAVDRCKVGDVVLEMQPDSAFAGSRVVVELKRAPTSTTQALAELQQARANRGAQVGLFVLAVSHAAPGFPPFSRFGQDVLLTVDPEAPDGALLRAAVLLCLGLLSRTGDTADLEAGDGLAGLTATLQGELERIAAMQRLVHDVRQKANKLEDELRKAERALSSAHGDAIGLLERLRGTGNDPVRERSTPLILGSSAAK